MLNDEELTRLLVNGESDRVERKASASDLGEIKKAICAFANDLPGHGLPGVVFIGVHDDGRCAGIDPSDKLLLSLANLGRDGSILPHPSLDVSKKVLNGCVLVVAHVQPSSNPPVKVDGRCWIRIGPRKATATADDERRLIERRRYGNLPFDQQGVVGAALDDMDLARFRLEYLPAVVPLDIREENGRSEADQLKALRLMTLDGLPTNAAILLLGKDPRFWLPGAYVQFARYEGTEITDPIKDSKELGGNLLDQFRQLDDLLRINIEVASDLSGDRERQIPDYPLAALQELVRNALIHRNYEGSNTPTRINWYSDRVEITSPGGPFGEVNERNFGALNITSYRNPAIAEAAKALSYVQRFGMGIARARRALRENGNADAQVTIEPGFVHWKVWARR